MHVDAAMMMIYTVRKNEPTHPAPQQLVHTQPPTAIKHRPRLLTRKEFIIRNPAEPSSAFALFIMIVTNVRSRT